jgi:hypothetical protein
LGCKAFYLRKGEKGLVPRYTTNHQGSCRKRTGTYYHNFGYQAFQLRKSGKSLLPQSTTDHHGKVAEKEFITTTLAIKLFTWERVRRVFSPSPQQITREKLQKKDLLDETT